MLVRVQITLLLCLLIGCSGVKRPGDPNLKTSKVTGTVTIDGTPTAMVFVAFHPEANPTSVEETVTTATNYEGKFNVVMPAGNEGLPAGNYLITFKQFSAMDRGDNRPDILKGSYSNLEKDTANWPYKVTVVEGKPMELGPFELSTKPKS